MQSAKQDNISLLLIYIFSLKTIAIIQFYFNFWFTHLYTKFGCNVVRVICKKDLEIEAMRESADSIVNVLKSLANTDRLIILCHLAKQELNVSQIEVLTHIFQPTLSNS